MANKTEIVCLCEGKHGSGDRGDQTSVDSVFINCLIRSLKPSWIKKQGSNFLRILPKGGRKNLIASVPDELRACLSRGGKTTLMVWADIDDDKKDGDELKDAFWQYAQSDGITRDQFDQIVFIFAKDRIENWIEFLLTGGTDESKEGPRVKHGRKAADAAKNLAKRCGSQDAEPPLPASLAWSCKNWHALAKRMKSS